MATELRRRDLWRGVLRSLARPLANAPARRPPRPPPPPAPPPLPPIPLRPPGARPETEFLSLCQRCGACREACEPGILLELGEAYHGARGTPGFFPETGPCQLCPELPCAAACPSGALAPPSSWTSARMGRAQLRPEHCLDLLGTPCDLCALACPSELRAIRLTSAGPLIAADRCTGCGLCVAACPAQPKAMRVRLLET